MHNFLALGLSLLCTYSLSAASVVTNGDGSLGDAAPSAWEATEGVTAVRDTAIFSSAPASIGLVLASGNGNVGQKIDGLAGSTAKISCKARAEDLNNVQVFALIFDQNWRTIAWRKLMAVPTDGVWHDVSSRETIPGNAGVVLFGIFGDGAGKAWIDDVIITKE